MNLFKNQSNSNTWERVLRGDVAAYQIVVESHQSAVSAVAYAIVGDFPISQDIAQETFWVAWTKRDSLRDARKLGSWLCGIARNLARQWRKKHKKVAQAAGGDLPFEPVAEGFDPLQQSIVDEEQQVVWSALEQIPEQFREVLTLYYRQGQSIAEVADALDISGDAARQRLSRGRNMLKGRVSQLVEGVLTNTKPDKTFVAKVIGGLVGAGMVAKVGTASASSLSVAKTVGGATAGATIAKNMFASGAAFGMVGGSVGGTFGMLYGILGGILGVTVGLAFTYFLSIWLPGQLAPTETERHLQQQQGRTVFRLTVVFMIGMFLLTVANIFLGFTSVYLVAHFTMVIAFLSLLFLQVFRVNRLSIELRKNIDADSDPNQSQLARFGRKIGVGKIRKGRSYTSPVEWLGYPLIDIQISDADFGGNLIDKKNRRHARGWIALGDKATGILFAYGGIARGFIAIGGLAIGVISFGGCSVGVFSLGGLAIGMWALGAGAIGYQAMGGGAIGYDAAGGLAIGWHSAVGGLALSWHLAFGGLAAAQDYAVGGAAFADETNTVLAEQMLDSESLKLRMETAKNYYPLFVVGITVAVLLHAFLLLKFVYRSDESDEVEANDKP